MMTPSLLHKQNPEEGQEKAPYLAIITQHRTQKVIARREMNHGLAIRVKLSFSQTKVSSYIECEYCKTHRCIKCLNMPALCYKSLSGREDFPWFCNNCLSKTLKCIREVKSIEERCNEFMRKFEEQSE